MAWNEEALVTEILGMCVFELFELVRTSTAAEAVEIGFALDHEALALHRLSILVERRYVLTDCGLAVWLPARCAYSVSTTGA